MWDKEDNKLQKDALRFFQDIPDDTLVYLALYDWGSLEMLCLVLALDLQEIPKPNNKWANQ